VLLTQWLGQTPWTRALVFTRTKHRADKVASVLRQAGIEADAFHADKSQSARQRTLARFKSPQPAVLVATDIAARGLDIDQLPHVVNFELPNVPEDYVHRIGRTGRAGNEGEAISLVCVDEHKLLRDIEHLLKHRIPQEFLDGYDPDPTIKAEPIPNGRNRHLFPREGQERGRGQRQGQGQRPAQRSDQATPRTGAPRRSEGEGAGRGQSRPGATQERRSEGNRERSPGLGQNRGPGQSRTRPDGRPEQSRARPAGQRFDAPRRPQGEADGNRVDNRAGNQDDDRGNRREPPRADARPPQAPRRREQTREVPALLGGGNRR